MSRPLPGLGLIHRFCRDRRGVSAIEFALIAPFLIVLYMGLAELSQGMAAQRRTSHAASAIGDLVTQSDALTTADLTDIMNAAGTLMRPFASTGLKLRITSVTADATGNPKADWSCGKNGLTSYSAGAAVVVPAGLLAAGDNLLIAESQYTYISPVTTLLPRPLTFSEKFFLKARKGAKVNAPGC
jgi:Flp pilus assembly protein TadG